jgi:hypothetical protein
MPVLCIRQPVGASVVEKWEPLVRENGWIMVITGYIDESYDGKDHPDDFTLACIMCSAEDWKGISSRWRELFRKINENLSSQGRKPITRYKAAECNGSHDEFEGWSRQEKLALTLQMSEIFDHARIKLTHLAYSLHLSKIHEKIPSVLDPKAFAYAMLFQQIIKGSLEMLNVLKEESSITFIHDRCDYDQVYLALFNLVLMDADAEQKRKLTTVSPMANEDCPPLEIADLIAYENYKHHINQSEGKTDKRTIDYLVEQGRLGGKSSIILDEQFSISKHHLDTLKWCSSFGGKCLRYPELDARE